MKAIRVFILSIICVFVLSGISYGAETSEVMITVPFPNFSETEALKWDFPYSDDYFSEPSDSFHQDLAKATLGLTLSAFRNNKGLMENQYETYLKGAGFQDIYAFGYDQETSKDTLSGVIAHKKIGDFTLIAAAPCGQGYKKEWAGNLEVGDEERHVGFNHAAEIMEEEIHSYIENNHLEGPLKLWIGGFSRASAVSNLTAADMIDSGQFADVYAYLFAVPRTTKDPDVYLYKGIYNICGKYDPVTQIPAEAWGYERYGTDLYTPALEMDSSFYTLAYNASVVNQDLIGGRFWYNPEVNYQLHLIIEFICELFPTNAEYAEKFQDSLMEIWSESNPETFLIIFSQAIDQMENLDQRQEYSSDVFVDYLQYLASSLIQEDRQQVKRGFWNQDQGIVDNMMREHMPYTYIDWAFSDNEELPLYHGPSVARRVYIYGNMDVEVWKDGTMLRGIDRKGEDYFPEIVDEENGFFDVLLIRNGDETLASLPYDGNYQIRLKTNQEETIFMYDILSMPYLTFGDMDKIYFVKLDKGEYVLDYSDGVYEFDLKTIDGEVQDYRDIPYQYSPTMVMAGACGAESYITVPKLFIIILSVVLFFILLLLVCLIIAIVHFIRKKKRGKPYSAWFVIVPHLIVAAVFAVLTEFFTMNMFSIGFTREACAFITMAAIFLLSLRGLIRNRSIRNLIITILIAGLAVVNVFVYQRSSIVSSRLIILIIYCLCTAGVCALAVSTFFFGRKKVDQKDTLEL